MTKDTNGKRWKATCIHQTDAGPIEIEYFIEEIEELHYLIEAGPDWNTLDHIRIDLNRRTSCITIEQALTK